LCIYISPKDRDRFLFKVALIVNNATINDESGVTRKPSQIMNQKFKMLPN